MVPGDFMLWTCALSCLLVNSPQTLGYHPGYGCSRAESPGTPPVHAGQEQETLRPGGEQTLPSGSSVLGCSLHARTWQLFNTCYLERVSERGSRVGLLETNLCLLFPLPPAPPHLPGPPRFSPRAAACLPRPRRPIYFT